MDTKSQSEKDLTSGYDVKVPTVPTPPQHTHGGGGGAFVNTSSTGAFATSGNVSFPLQAPMQAPNGAPAHYYQYQQQYPATAPYYTHTTTPNQVGLWEGEDAKLAPEDIEGAIEFIENLMFLLVATLDECDVPNQGGIMDRSEGARVESVIDLGEYEIIIRPKI